MKKTTKLQELFHREKIFILAGGGCALHARMAEAIGYEAAYMSGGWTCATIHGIPDAALITMTEMVENAKRMANAVSIPLLSDSDQGFGSAINVRRTVQSFIQAGVAGIHIEDQVAARRCGFVKGKEVVPLEEAVGKYRAAVDAKMELDPDFVIVARCDARTAVGGGLEEVIRRLKAYKKAGVDVLYFEAPQSCEEIRAARAELEGPLMATVSAIEPWPDIDEQQELGLAAAFIPRMMAQAGVMASWDYASDFLKRGVKAEMDLRERYKDHPLAGYGWFDLVGFPTVRQWEEKYLPAESLQKYEKSAGLYDPTKRPQR
ncbi:MAG: isocitrate lyase/PEP mutase family protein [Chloroflexi bacterium]|nr:isocitrate lyase/PEP mutase family protein [Chloroflexota bacterium]